MNAVLASARGPYGALPLLSASSRKPRDAEEERLSWQDKTRQDQDQDQTKTKQDRLAFSEGAHHTRSATRIINQTDAPHHSTLYSFPQKLSRLSCIFRIFHWTRVVRSGISASSRDDGGVTAIGRPSWPSWPSLRHRVAYPTTRRRVIRGTNSWKRKQPAREKLRRRGTLF